MAYDTSHTRVSLAAGHTWNNTSRLCTKALGGRSASMHRVVVLLLLPLLWLNGSFAGVNTITNEVFLAIADS